MLLPHSGRHQEAPRGGSNLAKVLIKVLLIFLKGILVTDVFPYGFLIQANSAYKVSWGPKM
jgi:hypothetical protein